MIVPAAPCGGLGLLPGPGKQPPGLEERWTGERKQWNEFYENHNLRGLEQYQIDNLFDNWAMVRTSACEKLQSHSLPLREAPIAR